MKVSSGAVVGAADSKGGAIARVEGEPIPTLDFDPPSEAARSIGLEIGTFQSMAPMASTATPHRHTFYEMVLIEHGEGEHHIDFASYPVSADSLFVVVPGQVHSWRAERPLAGRLVLFTEEFLLSTLPRPSVGHELAFFSELGGAPHLHLDQQTAAAVQASIRELETELDSRAVARESMVRALLHVFLVRLWRWSGARHESGPTPHLVRRFRKLLSEPVDSQWSVSRFARELGVSPAHLHDRVKRSTGRTPGQWIRERIVLEAKRLLAHSELGIAEVGYRLRFEDPSYFGRFFRREVGLSPGRFRREIREKYQKF